MGRYRFALPDLGEGVAEGEILQWLVEPGQQVDEDDGLLEVETDKAGVEIPSPVSGVVRERHGEPGDVVAVGTVLVEIEVPDEAGADDGGGGGGGAPYDEGAAVAAGLAPSPEAQEQAPQSQGPKATPAVRRVARELGVDLTGIDGSGPGGRILEDDVRAEADGGRTPQPAGRAAPSRRTIARRLTEAAAVPTVTNVDSVDMEAVTGAGIAPLTALARACVIALGEHPRLNGWCEDGLTLQVQDDVHLGIATQSEHGLVVPVVRDAGSLDLEQLGARIAEVAGAAREGRMQPGDLRGSTFTITSAGRLAGQFSTPLLNLPEVAILGLYRIEPRPAVRDGEVVVRSMSHLSITFDHRVLDGLDAARFLARVRELLEDWPAGDA